MDNLALQVAHLAQLYQLEELIEVERRRRTLRDRCNPFEIYDEKDFKRRFRLHKATAHDLLLLISNEIHSPPDDRRNPLTPMQQLLLTLRFFATGSYNQVVGDIAGVHESTVCRAVGNVTQAIGALKGDIIKLPNENELPGVMADFARMSRDNFPGIVGAIDCTHIRICCPNRLNAQAYINRKGYYSVNVQVIADANLRIRNIVARWPGSTHDSRIFRCSTVKEQLESGRLQGHLLGDSGYPCKRYLLTPLRNPVTNAEVRYNTAHRKARCSVERTFGVWKKRFPCISTGLRTNIRKTVKIVVATAILHNFALQEGWNVEEEVNGDEVWVPHARENDAGGQRWRQHIINVHFS